MNTVAKYCWMSQQKDAHVREGSSKMITMDVRRWDDTFKLGQITTKLHPIFKNKDLNILFCNERNLPVSQQITMNMNEVALALWGRHSYVLTQTPFQTKKKHFLQDNPRINTSVNLTFSYPD